MSELERAVALLVALHLGIVQAAGPGAAADVDEELRALVILLAKRNRAGADPSNIERRARAASGIVAVDNKLHDPYVIGSKWEGTIDPVDMDSHASVLLLPPKPDDL